MIKDPALSQYIPFLAEVPPHDHHQEEAQVINLIADIYNPDHPIPVVTCTLMYLVHPEIPLPGITDIREDTILYTMQQYARFIEINLRYLRVDVNKLLEGRSHFLLGTLYEEERMIEWLEVQGYPILENTFVDCNHYLTHDKEYEILNIYDNKLPQIQAYQDSCQLDIPPTRVCTKMYHSENGLFLSMFP